MAAVRPGAVVVVAVAVLVAGWARAATGTRLRPVDSSAPWDGGAEDAVKEASKDTMASQHEDKVWSWRQAAMSVLKECLSASTDTGSCVRTKAMHVLSKVANAQREINLGAGLVLVPDRKEASSRSLPADPPSEQEALGLLSLMQNYSLRLQLPSARTIRQVMDSPALAVNASAFSGRKRNGGLGPLLVFGSSLLPVKMSVLALLVGKALMLSTLAFAIPALRLLQQGGGMGGGAGGGGGGHHCH